MEEKLEKKEKSEDTNEKDESLRDCGKRKYCKSVLSEFNKIKHFCKDFEKKDPDDWTVED